MDTPTEEHRRADGVAYFTYPGLPTPMFACDSWRAKLTVPACENRWRQAQAARGEDAERLAKCRTCQLGSFHAGQPIAYRSPLFGQPICPRCGRGSGGRRMISDRLCISCANRFYEVLKNRNAKGKPPQKLKLQKIRLGVVLDHGTPEAHVVVYEDWAADVEVEAGRWAPGFEELMTQVLRTTEGRVAFVAAPDDAPTWEPPRPKPGIGASKCAKSTYL